MEDSLEEKFEYWLLFKYWAQNPYKGSPTLKELRKIYELDVSFHLDFENRISKFNWEFRLKKIKQGSISI